jgi:hypothetical protein
MLAQSRNRKPKHQKQAMKAKISGGLWPLDGQVWQVLEVLSVHKIGKADSLVGVRVRSSWPPDSQIGPSRCKCFHLSLSFPRQRG